MKHYPEEPHDTPPPENFNIFNFSNSALVTNTFNQAIKSRRVMEEKITERER